jgi:hypothetical protein
VHGGTPDDVQHRIPSFQEGRLSELQQRFGAEGFDFLAAA